MYRMYGMPWVQGCTGTAMYRMYGMLRAQGYAGAAYILTVQHDMMNH